MNRVVRFLSVSPALLCLCFVLCSSLRAAEAKRPNIIVILTDDQGYGDLGAHGHPFLKTPNLDRLHRESVRFTDWTISPTCAPTRSALLTGRHEFHNGITHTILERERLTLKATTLAQVLQASGYATGIFGKWHLGDEEPYQPPARGFDETFIHGGGGIGQSYPGSCGDAPGNDYFNPVIRHNGTFEKTEGYCTDVFFSQASKWIDSRVKPAADGSPAKPFFCWIATNAPHGPLICPPEWSEPYREKTTGKDANFFGMIANIDHNVGRLLAMLEERKLTRDTLVVFLNDNGTASGTPYFNAGMRANKGSPHRGGTRGMSLWRWPETLKPGDCAAVTAHLDFFPTIAEIAGAKVADDVTAKLEGFSLVPLLKNPSSDWSDAARRERTLFTHVGRWPLGKPPVKFGACSVRRGQYLFFPSATGGQLYNLVADPGEKTDVAAAHPEVCRKFAEAYDAWWTDTLPQLVNEEGHKTAPKINPFHELYWKQFAGPGPNDFPPTSDPSPPARKKKG